MHLGIARTAEVKITMLAVFFNICAQLACINKILLRLNAINIVASQSKNVFNVMRFEILKRTVNIFLCAVHAGEVSNGLNA